MVFNQKLLVNLTIIYKVSSNIELNIKFWSRKYIFVKCIPIIFIYNLKICFYSVP